MNLSQFAGRMRTYSSRIEKNAERLSRRVASNVVKAVVEATPVDTGRARSNWVVSFGSPRLDTRPPHAPGRFLGRSERANWAAAVAAAENVLKFRSSKDIWISNNLHYIGLLNNGYSRQSPANFVSKGVAAGIQSIRGVSLLRG